MARTAQEERQYQEHLANRPGGPLYRQVVDAGHDLRKLMDDKHISGNAEHSACISRVYRALDALMKRANLSATPNAEG